MAKLFDGGINPSVMDLLLEALDDINKAVNSLTRTVLVEENQSAQVDQEKLAPGSEACGAITAARKAVHDAIGPDKGTLSGARKTVNDMTGVLNELENRVRDLHDSFTPVLLDPGSGPRC